MKNACLAVCGVSITAFNRRKDASSFRDWAFTVFEEALALSTLERCEIDALYVASESDFFTLQLNPASILTRDLGLIGAATMRIEGGGASGQLAVHAATRAIQSGHIKHAAVIGVDPSASHLSGAAVKSLYSYSFEPAHHWSQYFSQQGELQQYFESVVDTHDLRDNFRFNTEVKSAVYDEGSQLWTVSTV